jgi:hypothetical protein
LIATHINLPSIIFGADCHHKAGRLFTMKHLTVFALPALPALFTPTIFITCGFLFAIATVSSARCKQVFYGIFAWGRHNQIKNFTTRNTYNIVTDFDSIFNIRAIVARPDFTVRACDKNF